MATTTIREAILEVNGVNGVSVHGDVKGEVVREAVIEVDGAFSRESTPELNPLLLGGLQLEAGDENGATVVAKAAADVIAPMPEYKAAGETVIGFDGLLAPAPDLRLREDLTNGCGGQTWPAGMVLAKHMLRYHKGGMANARILELGAGGGLVGLAVALANQAARNGAAAPASASPMYITDQLPMFELMGHNIELNGLTQDVKPLILNWGEPLPQEVLDQKPNVILAADCVYFEPAFPLLLATLEDLMALADDVVVYFCFKKRRRADTQFVKKAQKKFIFTEVVDEDRPVFSREGLFLYTFTKKPVKGQAVKGAKAAHGTQPEQ